MTSQRQDSVGAQVLQKVVTYRRRRVKPASFWTRCCSTFSWLWSFRLSFSNSWCRLGFSRWLHFFSSFTQADLLETRILLYKLTSLIVHGHTRATKALTRKNGVAPAILPLSLSPPVAFLVAPHHHNTLFCCPSTMAILSVVCFLVPSFYHGDCPRCNPSHH